MNDSTVDKQGVPRNKRSEFWGFLYEPKRAYLLRYIAVRLQTFILKKVSATPFENEIYLVKAVVVY